MDKAFSNLTFVSNGNACITPKNAFQLCNSFAILVDLRMPYLSDFKKFKINNIINIPFNKLGDHLILPDKQNMLILADTTNTKSTEAYIYLKQNGYKNLAILSGGMVEWERDGLPIIIDKKKQLSGSCVCQLKTRNI